MRVCVCERKSGHVADALADTLEGLGWSGSILPRARQAELAVLGERGASPKGISCQVLLAPADWTAQGVEAGRIVRYGLSPQDSVSLSSFGDWEAAVSVMHEISTIYGDKIEPGEITLRRRRGLSPMDTLAFAGSLILLGYDGELLF